MSNPLFNALGGGMPQGNGPMQMIQSGKISQQQLNQVQQMAGQFQHMLKGMK